MVRASVDQFGEARWMLRLMPFLGDMADVFGRMDRVADGLSMVGEALVHSEQTEARWMTAEFLRFKGELLLAQGAKQAAAEAKDHFQQALELARRQGALSWELRTATSLARLLIEQRRPAQAKAALLPVYERFTEGFDSADLRTARVLIDGFA